MIKGDIKAVPIHSRGGAGGRTRWPFWRPPACARRPNAQDRGRDPASPQKYGGPVRPGSAPCSPIILAAAQRRLRRHVQTMVSRFNKVWQHADAQRLESCLRWTAAGGPGQHRGRKGEHGRPEERTRIYCVFHNRMKKKDVADRPDGWCTAAVALERLPLGSQHPKGDLSLQHPYKHLRDQGCHQGPIANPGGRAGGGAQSDPCDDLSSSPATITRTCSARI